MPESIAVIAAHPDDEVLGCGGTLARFAEEGFDVHILLLADGVSSRVKGKESGEGEAKRQRELAAIEACRVLGASSVKLMDLEDNRLDGLDLLDIVKPVEDFLKEYKPAKVFTHHAGDVNIDHTIVHRAIQAACRPLPKSSVRELLFFEVPSSTEWMTPGSGVPFVPNYFVDISETLERKLQALKVYEEELRGFPHPRSIEGVKALARWRGASVGVEASEAFILGRKIT